MADKDAVREKALQTVELALYGVTPFARSLVGHSEQAVDALLSAGLLRTGVERECVEALKRMATMRDARGWNDSAEVMQAYEAGRAALAAEKPAPKWEVGPLSDSEWSVFARGTAITRGLTESQARVVAKALNEADRT